MAVSNINCEVPKLIGKKGYNFWNMHIETRLEAYNLYMFVEQEVNIDANENTKRKTSMALSQIH